VLCEKPPGRSAVETAQMAAAASRSGCVLKVGFNHRHHPAVWQAHQACAEGVIGTPHFIRAVYGHGGRPGYDKEWRGSADLAGGGELLDQGVHILDLCRWFIGEFNQVYAQTATYFWPLGYFAGENSPRMEDNAFALLRTAAGQTAQFHTSWTQWKNRFSFEVFGDKGYIRIEGFGGSYGIESLTIGLRRQESGPPDEQHLQFEGPDLSWQAEWQEFKDAVANHRQPLASGEDGLQTMRLLEALYASARTDQVVHL
jgi:predicted dehydrogenase